MFLQVPTTTIRRGLIVFVTTVFFAQPAFAYVGPGAGLTAIGTMVAVIAALALALVGFIWYPLKRVMRRKRPADQIDGTK